MLAAQAIERATGTAPALVRSGGSIPVVAEFAARDIPTIVSGFGLPDDDIHAPNESYRLESLELGERTARELLPVARGTGTLTAPFAPGRGPEYARGSRHA